MTQQGSKVRPVKKAHASLPRYDQALLSAKNDRKQVIFHLAFPFTEDEDFEIVGRVCLVDKYDVLVELAGATAQVWIKKAYIVTTVIQ